MNTKTRIETTVVDQRHATSAILHGGASNSYYADERSRQVVTRVIRNVHGEYVAQLGKGRTLDFAGNERELFNIEITAQSPVFTVVDDAREWACTAAHWALANMVQLIGPEWKTFPVARERHTYCPSCGHFDTLNVEQQAWGDATTCSTHGCDFDDWRSIGD